MSENDLKKENSCCNSEQAKPTTSVTREKSANINNTCSGTKIVANDNIAASTVRKLSPSSDNNRNELCLPPGGARIRMASTGSKIPKSSVQTTTVFVTGTGLKPTPKDKCIGPCTGISPKLSPANIHQDSREFLPPGMYYVPAEDASGQPLASEDMKIRTKIIRQPAAVQQPVMNWQMQPNNFAGQPASVLQPNLAYSHQQQQRQSQNTSLPADYWCMNMNESMSFESGEYEQENPNGERERIGIQQTRISRNLDGMLPGSKGGPCKPIRSPRIPPTPTKIPGCAYQPIKPRHTTFPQFPPRQSPQVNHTINVNTVRAPHMQSPVGDITASQTINVQRKLQASAAGTTIDTSLLGTRLTGPCEAKQININKREYMAPPPPLQYVMPPRTNPDATSYGSSPDSRTCCSPNRLYGGSPSLSSRSNQGKSMTLNESESQKIPIKIPEIPDKYRTPLSPIRLDTSIEIPTCLADVSLDVIRRLVDEEIQDVSVSQELPPSLAKKLNKLKKKPQSMRVLEETLDQSIPIDEESETIKSDIIAELMHNQETGAMKPTNSPKKTYDILFPPLQDEEPISVCPAAPAPLHDIVVPVGEADVSTVAVVNEELENACAGEEDDIPVANAFAEALAQEETQLPGSVCFEHKSREERLLEEGEEQLADSEYLLQNEGIEGQKNPWDINLGSLEDLVGGKMSMMSEWEELPSDESIRATAGRLEYVLDVQKPLHYSCIQLRGSQLPAWFPGFYSVFPHVDGFVRLEKSPSRAFATAWHIFAPYQQNTDQSEIMIL